jgi:hypothetical protein
LWDDHLFEVNLELFSFGLVWEKLCFLLFAGLLLRFFFTSDCLMSGRSRRRLWGMLWFTLVLKNFMIMLIITMKNFTIMLTILVRILICIIYLARRLNNTTFKLPDYSNQFVHRILLQIQPFLIIQILLELLRIELLLNNLAM